MIKRVFALVGAAVFFSSLCLAQTLAEAAKKEKERREILKGQTSVAVTNADLAQVKKKPAVDTPKGEPPKEGETPPGSAPAAALAPPPALDLKVPTPGVESQAEYDAKKTELQSKLALAKERIDLLNLKIQALWQQYYQFNSMRPKDQIQKEIAETNLKLQAAAAEEKKTQDELAKFMSQAPPTIIK
jgi:hypothetical protein